jgi:hypothetical protein
MLYNPNSEHDVKKARVRFEQLIEKGKPFELTDISKRSLRKNAFVHVLLQYLALEMGWTLSYTKQRIWKALWCKEIFVIKRVSQKTGEEFTDIRSSADLSEEEMQKAIDILIEKASMQCGVLFPNKTSSTFDNDFAIMQKEIWSNQQYL